MFVLIDGVSDVKGVPLVNGLIWFTMPSVYWLEADIHSLGICLVHHSVEGFLSEQGYPNKGGEGYPLSK